MKENLTITALGIGSVLVLAAIAFAAAVYNIPNFDKWLGVGLWTIAVFGLVAYLQYADLKKIRCLLVFVSALLLHLILIIHYFPSHPGALNSFYYIFYPFEVAAVAALMYILGGSRRGRHWTRRFRHNRGRLKLSASKGGEVHNSSDLPGSDT